MPQQHHASIFSGFYISFGNIDAIRICPTAQNGFTLPPDSYLSY